MAWLTRGIKHSIKNKNRLFTVSCKNSHSGTSYEKYKQYDKVLSEVKSLSKQQYFKENFFLSKGDLKQTWKTINQVIKKSVTPATIQSLNCPSSNIPITDRYQLSNYLNDYFSTVGSDLADAFPKTTLNLSMSTSQNLNSIFINRVCLKDVIMQIDCLNSNKCDDAFDIPVRIIKLCIDLIALIVEELFNGCILKGIYPPVLKTAKVIPIYEDGIKKCPSNYRPISLLNFSKLFENILQIDLTKFLTKHQIISKCEYGFQENLSTTDALIDMCIHLQSQRAQKNINSGVTPLKFFSDYLTNRFQFCSVDSIKSNSRLITCGVLQGSILEPILFLIHVNDLPKMTNLKTILFADDTALSPSRH